MSDEEIISLFFARDEQALVYTEAKYGPYCFALANAILPIQEDAEETVSDTEERFFQCGILNFTVYIDRFTISINDR